MKATHKGTCQVCGRGQKLPNGNLSLHGYTTEWGFFAGTCHGALFLPFELSKSLIEEAIGRAVMYTEECRNNAQSARELTDQKKVWRLKVEYKRRGEVRTWAQDEIITVALSSNGSPRERTSYQWKSGEGTIFGKITLFQQSLEEYIVMCNEHRGLFWDREVDRLNSYVKWQQNRIKNWKPEPHKLIKIMS